MLVLLNPHKNHLYGLVKQRLDSGEAVITKLQYFLNSFIKNPNSKFLVDRQAFPDNPFSLRIFFSSLFFEDKRLREWERFNDFPLKMPLVTWDEISEKDTIILSAKDLRYRKLPRLLAACNAGKLVLLTNHYCHHPDVGQHALSGFQGRIELISEVPVSMKPIYKDYLPPFIKEYCFGYVVSDRFFCKTKFLERKKRALVTGSYSLGRKRNVVVESFLYGNELNGSQHYRYKIDKNVVPSSTMLDSLLSERSRDKMLNKKFKSSVKDYYSMDLNEAFNSYMLVVVPPDSFDVTPLIMFEAMACGAIVVAMADPTLEALGIFEGKHYVSFDFKGDLNALDEFLRSSINESEQLHTIHENALKLVEGFRSKRVKSKVDNYLEGLVSSSKFEE